MASCRLLEVEVLALADELLGHGEVDAVGLAARRCRRSTTARSRAGRGCRPAPRGRRSPPALLTAATTSRQWEKANSGNSMPRRSAMGVLMAPPSRSPASVVSRPARPIGDGGYRPPDGRDPPRPAAPPPAGDDPRGDLLRRGVPGGGEGHRAQGLLDGLLRVPGRAAGRGGAGRGRSRVRQLRPPAGAQGGARRLDLRHAGGLPRGPPQRPPSRPSSGSPGPSWRRRPPP